jgi:hypothetical protein
MLHGDTRLKVPAQAFLRNIFTTITRRVPPPLRPLSPINIGHPEGICWPLVGTLQTMGYTFLGTTGWPMFMGESGLSGGGTRLVIVVKMFRGNTHCINLQLQSKIGAEDLSTYPTRAQIDHVCVQ